MGRVLTLTKGRNLRLSWSKNMVKTIRDRYGDVNAGLALVFIESYTALLLDSPDTNKPFATIKKFFFELLNGEIGDVILRYKTLADRILKTMSDTSELTITGEFVDEMKETPVFREYLHFYRTGDARHFRFLLTFLNFGKKLKFEDPELEATALREWLEIESELGDLSIPSSVTFHLKKIISSSLREFDDTILLPKHGSGYTSEGYIDPNEKLDTLSFDDKSLYVFRRHAFGRFDAVRQSTEIYTDIPVEDFLGVEQIARHKRVPKTKFSMRSIVMETISRMMLQQDVARWLINAMEAGFEDIVTLRDQGGNQQYATAGSATFTCDTIDLSSASDRISADLVKEIFPAKVLFYLFGTRTNLVDIGDGVVFKMKKFAPMGSALCFPVQCIIFTSIVLLAHLMHHYGIDSVDSLTEGSIPWDRISYQLLKRFHSNPWEHKTTLLSPKVYGDDIICDYRVTDDVLDLLVTCGFKVNSEKSYTGQTAFRESCGVFALSGEDVTPLLFRLPGVGLDPRQSKIVVGPQALASFFDQVNNAGDFGYSHLRSSLINQLKRMRIVGVGGSKGTARLLRSDPFRFVPFSSRRDDFGIFTNSPRPPRTEDILGNWKYQRDERRVMVLTVSEFGRESDLMDTYMLDQWYRARIRGGSPSDVSQRASRIRPRVTRVTLGWTPW